MKGEKLGDDRMPEREAGFSQAIIGLGNVGAHPKKQPVSMADVAQGLQMLEPLLQWYLRMAPAPEKGAGGKPAKEKAPRPEPTAESEGTARVPGKKPEKDKGAPKKPLEKPSAAEAPEKPRPTVPPAAPAALTVSFLLSYSTDGQAWQALAAGGRAPRGSRLRALVQAEVGCHLLLLIETLDAQGQAVELQAFGPGAADLPRAGAGATAVRQVGLWESLPPGRVLLERQMERAAAWRVGLLAQAAPPDELLRRLAEPGDRAAAVRQALAGLPEPAVRPVALPLVTRVGFGLNAGASARRLEGPQPWAYWSEVRFA
jgi:hypothetical protein